MGLFGNNPDYSKVEESRNTIMYLDNELKKIKDSEAKANRTVRVALDAFVFDELKEILMNVDVEEVNRDKDGIRTSLLRNAGIKNVWQLENLSVNQLTMVRGIGEQKLTEYSYDKIMEDIQSLAN